MRACARAPTDAAASTGILVLITAKQTGNRESDPEIEPRERLQGDQEDPAGVRQDPRALGLIVWTSPRAGRGDRSKVCASVGPELSRDQGQSSPRRWQEEEQGLVQL